MRRAAKPPAPLSPYTVTDSPVARAKRSATSCPFFPPPLIDVVPVDIYRCAAWRANDEGRVVPPSVPISGRSASSAASRQQSLSSYPAGRSQLSYFHRYRSTHHSKFAPVPSMEPRSWHILTLLASSPRREDRRTLSRHWHTNSPALALLRSFPSARATHPPFRGACRCFFRRFGR